MKTATLRRSTVLLLAILLWAVLAAPAGAVWQGTLPTAQASGFGGGDGSQAAPYRITSEAELAQMAANYNAALSGYDQPLYWLLCADLDLGGLPWPGIGNRADAAFSGVFDGHGQVIRGVNVRQEAAGGSAAAGCFGYLAAGAELRDLELRGAVLALCGQADQAIYAGGLCGWAADTAAVSNCAFFGSVTILPTAFTSSEGYVGGLIGYASYPFTLSNCLFAGQVTNLADSWYTSRFVGGGSPQQDFCYTPQQPELYEGYRFSGWDTLTDSCDPNGDGEYTYSLLAALNEWAAANDQALWYTGLNHPSLRQPSGQPLAAPTGLAWSADKPLLATWQPLPQAAAYQLQLYRDGVASGEPLRLNAVSYDFSAYCQEAGNYSFTVQALGDYESWLPGPEAESPAYAVYGVWVAGRQLTEANAADPLGDGSISYADGVLRLNNAAPAAASVSLTLQNQWGNTFTQRVCAPIVATQSLTLELAGDNSLELRSDDTGFDAVAAVYSVGGSLTVSGSGSLTLQAAYGGYASLYGLYCQELLSWTAGSLIAELNGAYAYGLYGGGGVSISGGSLYIRAIGDSVGLAIAAPDQTLTFVDAESLALFASDMALEVEEGSISGIDGYQGQRRLLYQEGLFTFDQGLTQLWVGGVDILNRFSPTLPGVSFDPLTQVLTLTNVALSQTYFCRSYYHAAIYANGDLNLCLQGENRIRVSSSYRHSTGVLADGALNIYAENDGRLSVNTACRSGASSDSAICLMSDQGLLSVSDCSLRLYGEGEGYALGLYAENGGLLVDNAQVTVGFGSLTVPRGLYADAQQRDYAQGGGNVELRGAARVSVSAQARGSGQANAGVFAGNNVIIGPLAQLRVEMNIYGNSAFGVEARQGDLISQGQVTAICSSTYSNGYVRGGAAGLRGTNVAINGGSVYVSVFGWGDCYAINTANPSTNTITIADSVDSVYIYFQQIYGSGQLLRGLVTAPGTTNTNPYVYNPLPADKEILDCVLPGQAGTTHIDSENHLVTVTVYDQVDLTAATPFLTLSTGAACAPASGTAVDLSQPVTYTVTAASGASQTWTLQAEIVSQFGAGTIPAGAEAFLAEIPTQLADSADLWVAAYDSGNRLLTIQPLPASGLVPTVEGAAAYKLFALESGSQAPLCLNGLYTME